MPALCPHPDDGYQILREGNYEATGFRATRISQTGSFVSRPSAWCVVFLGLVLQPALPAREETLISALEVRGTRRAVQLETRAGDPLDLARVERDVRRLWSTGWFEDIQVESSDTVSGLRLTFALIEKPRLYLRKLEFKPGTERHQVDLPKGTPLDGQVAARAAATVRRHLVEAGYTDAKVEAVIVPVGFQKANLGIQVKRGPLYRVEAVRFSGTLGLERRELERAVEELHPRRLLPSLGSIWKGWRSLAPFSEKALEAGAQRLRSLYFSRGYLDARVEVGRTEVNQDRVTVVYQIEAGRRYAVRRLELPAVQREVTQEPDPTRVGEKLCACLLRARKESEKRGELGLNARLEVESFREPDGAAREDPAADRPFAQREPEVTLAAKILEGPAFRVGRIEFRSHRKVHDVTLRKALVLREGELFDAGRLRRSLARLNRLGLIEPLGPSDVTIEPQEGERLVNLTIPAKDAPRGYWSLSGPLGPLSPFGSLGFTIASRLPAVGDGPLELSTYYAGLSLVAWSLPLARLLPLTFETRWTPFVALRRPYLPGQGWLSGFTVAPQLGWKVAAGSYGLSRISEGLRPALGDDSLPAGPLTVPVVWRGGRQSQSAGTVAAGFLICEEKKPSWARLRSVVGTLIALSTGGTPAAKN